MAHKHSSLNYFDESSAEGKAWARGYVQCLRDYGIYRNGTQVIGCLEKPIKEVIKEVAESVGLSPEEI